LFPLWIFKNIHNFPFSLYLFSVFTLNFILKFILNKLCSDVCCCTSQSKTSSIWFAVLPSAEYHVCWWISLWKCTFYIKTFRYCELNHFYSVVVGLIT
jgi:hypothetical protein